MRITEDHIREFFPKDMRFTHYVAKRFGFKFSSDYDVDKANYKALEAVLSLYNRGIEFKDRSHLDGTMIHVFKFSILNSFKKKKVDKLDLMFESQLFEYVEDRIGYNKYQQKAVDKSNKDYDNTADVLKNELLSLLTEFEAKVFLLLHDKDLKPVEISKKLNVNYREIEKARLRIKTKFKQIIKNERHQFRDQQQELAVNENSTQTNKAVRRSASDKHPEQDEEKGNCSASAMLWLDTDA